MSRFSMRTALLASASLTALWGQVPSAPAAEAADPSPAADAIRLAPITVDARRWEETADRVPGTLAVVTDRHLASPVWQDLGDVVKLAPNVHVEQTSVQTRVVVRGATAANTGLQDPVGYFVNDVALPHGAQQAPILFDVERLELLKGPQATLYGRNTEAGAVKLSTADPTWSPSGSVTLTPSLRDGADGWEPAVTAAARVSGPLAADRAAASLAVRGETTDGVHRNRFDAADDGGRTDALTLSGGLTLLAGDDTDIRLKSVVQRKDSGKQRMRYVTGPLATGRYVTDYDTDSWDEGTTAVQSLRLDHRFDDVDLTAVTGWTHYRRDFRMDLDGTRLPTLPTLMDHDDDALSQEVRLASADPDATVRWVGGVYAFREWTDLDFSIGTPRVTRRTTIDQTGLAGFGQAEVTVAEGLRVGLGGRVEWVTQEGRQSYLSATENRTYGRDLDSVTVLPRVSLSYDLSPSTMVFASYARGYLPGGYNYGMATSAATLAYDPEYSWTAEAGVKGRLLDDRVTAGLTLFHTTTSDKQIVDLVPGGTQTINNAAEATVYGAEVSAEAVVADGWHLLGGLGLQTAEASSYRATVMTPAGLRTLDLSGNALPLAPEVTYSLGLRYDTGGDGWFGEAMVTGAGPYFFDSGNTLEQSGYAQVDAVLGYRVGATAVSLWAANLFDEEIYGSMVASRTGTLVEDGAPREVGLRVTTTW
ncbi:MAG: TonB-dependent receptor [Caenispirillum sp.]|nr:TonB-dependent receptor [Caenispirillum sp.]